MDTAPFPAFFGTVEHRDSKSLKFQLRYASMCRNETVREPRENFKCYVFQRKRQRDDDFVKMHKEK